MQMEYDANGKVSKQIDAMGGVTSFTYNDEGKLLSLTDSVSNTTKYEYDELGRLVKETNPLDKSRVFEYSFGGQVAKRTDRNGRGIAFEYNKFGRPITENWFDGTKTVKKSFWKVCGRFVSLVPMLLHLLPTPVHDAVCSGRRGPTTLCIPNAYCP